MIRRRFFAHVAALGLATALLPVLVPALVPPAAAAAPTVGDIFVADTGNNRVVQVTAAGQSAVGSGFNAPRGVAVDWSGNVWVADTGNNRIVKLPADGGAQVTVGSGFSAPRGVNVAPNGVVWVADTGNNRVVSMNADGSNIKVLDTHRPYLQNPIGLTSDPDGLMWIVYAGHEKIFRHNPTGTFQDEFGATTTASGGVAVAPDGSVFFNDTLTDKVLGSGHPIMGTGLTNPEGLGLTALGQVVVADTGNNRVVRMAGDGTGQVNVGSGFSAPSGVAVYAPAPTFTAASPPQDLTGGVPYSYTFQTSSPAGSPSPVIQRRGQGVMPAGITINPTTGTMAGTPTGGTQGFQFQVQAANGATARIVDVELVLRALRFTAASPPTPAQVGTPYSYTFQTIGAPAPTFTVLPELPGGTLLPPGLTLDPNTGVLSGSPTTVGSYPFYVVAANGFGNVQSNHIRLNVEEPKTAQAITFTTSPPSSAPLGGTHDINATGGGSGNPVTFSVHNTTTNNACTVNSTSGVVQFAHAGSCVVAADQAGNGEYAAAPQKLYAPIPVGQGTQAIAFTTSPPASAPLGGTHDVNATGGASGNPVTFSVHGSTTNNACTVEASTGVVTFQNNGSCVIAADQAGNADYTAAPQKLYPAFTVGKSGQAIQFTSTPPAQATVGGTHDVNATGGASANPVTFSVDAGTTNGACTVNASTGVVQFAHVGSCVIAADQAGNGDYDAAPQKLYPAIAVGKAGQAIQFTSSPPAQPTIGSTHDVEATGGASGNPVVFSVHASTTNGACTVNASTGVVQFVTLGTCVIAADQAGNAGHDPAPQKLYPAMTIKRSQSINTGQMPEVALTGFPADLYATGGASGNTVSYTSLTPAVCSVTSSGSATYLKAGTCTVRIDQAGSATYWPATATWDIEVFGFIWGF